MTKIIIGMLFLLNTNILADLVEDGFVEYKKGNKKQASKLYRKACNSQDMDGCINLGALYLMGDGVKQNHKKAKKVFVKACKQRYLKGCHHLGFIYSRGADDIEKNIKRAKKFYAHACKRGYIPSCKQYNLIREKPDVTGSVKM